MKGALAAILVASLVSPGQCGLKVVGNYVAGSHRLIFTEFCGPTPPVTYRTKPDESLLIVSVGIPSLPSWMTPTCGGATVSTSTTCTYSMCITGELSPNWNFWVYDPSVTYTCNVDAGGVGLAPGNATPINCCE